ncbi:MAG: hypothetical protein KF861_16020 [Planctomycetaceae bacterium]|nr:hypothetical protein [Planctomycetaceae bacterium]
MRNPLHRLTRTEPDASTALTEAALGRLDRQLRSFSQQIGRQDAVFEKQARLRLERMSEQLDELLRQELTFTQTETWRTVYEAILSGCQVRRYLSVALIEHEDYWRDQPGLASLEFNYDLVQFGWHVHRRFILDDYFWPPRAAHPATEVLGPIQEQATRGIDISLLRKSQLESEPHLNCDFGIYGERAAGYQNVDDQGRTTRYLVRFGKSAVDAAEELWRQLDLYAVSLDFVLDQRP